MSLLVPKKKDRVVFFCNESGLFGGNIKPIYLSALEQSPELDIVLISFSKDILKFKNSFLKERKIYRYPSFAGIWMFLTAKKLVIECGLRTEICGLAARSEVYQLWHGANLKYMVLQLDQLTGLKKKNWISKRVRIIKTTFPKYKFIVSPSEFYKENTFSKSFNADDVFVSGYPRNDLFFRETLECDWIESDKAILERAIEHRKNGGKVVLYCPTWRDKADVSDNAFVFTDKLTTFLEENNIYFVIKKHHRDPRGIIEKEHHLVDVYNHRKDIYLLMKNSDLLVSDYSSIFFDYLLLNKPVVFYPYDYVQYMTRDRMFQYDYEEFTPGKKCTEEDCLLDEMLISLNDQNYYQADRNRVKEIAFGKTPCENSSKHIWDEVIVERPDGIIDIAAFLSNSIYSFVQRIIGIVLTFLSVVMIARILGPEGQGQYSLLTSLVRTSFYFTALGAPVGLLFAFGKQGAERDRVVKSFLYFMSVLALFAIILCFSFFFITENTVFQGISIYSIFIIFLGIFIWYGNSFTSNILNGLENFKASSIAGILQSLILVLGVGTLFILDDVRVNHYLWVFNLSLLTTLFYNIFSLYKSEFKVRLFRSVFDFSIIKNNFSYSFKTYLGTVSQFLIYRVDMYIIAYFLPVKSLGLYVIAVNIVERLWMVAEALSKVLFSRLVNLHDEKEKNKVSIFSFKLAFYVSFIGSLLLWLVGPYFINLFFGEVYQESIQYFNILLPGVVCQSAGIIMKSVLEARAYPGTNARSSIVCLLLNLFLNFLLIPKYGVAGAAYATTFSYGSYFLLQLINLKRKFDLDITKLFFIESKDFVMLKDFLLKRSR